MADYNFTTVLKTDNFEIGIDPASAYGYFEHNRLGDNCGGGLWFDRLEGGLLALNDYDGVFTLPREVADALIAKGFIVTEDFLC